MGDVRFHTCRHMLDRSSSTHEEHCQWSARMKRLHDAIPLVSYLGGARSEFKCRVACDMPVNGKPPLRKARLSFSDHPFFRGRGIHNYIPRGVSTHPV